MFRVIRVFYKREEDVTLFIQVVDERDLFDSTFTTALNSKGLDWSEYNE